MDDANVSKPPADGEITPGKRVIDGWHRLRACAEIGISPVTMIACFYEEEIAKKVIGAHRGRRHRTKIDMARLTVATMDACGMERRDGPRRPPKKFGQVGPISERAEETDHEASIPEAITPEAVARDANVSERTARRAIGEAKQRNQDATEEEVRKTAHNSARGTRHRRQTAAEAASAGVELTVPEATDEGTRSATIEDIGRANSAFSSQLEDFGSTLQQVWPAGAQREEIDHRLPGCAAGGTPARSASERPCGGRRYARRSGSSPSSRWKTSRIWRSRGGSTASTGAGGI